MGNSHNRYPFRFTPDNLRHLSVSQIEKPIFPVGFYHDKARHLKALRRILPVRYWKTWNSHLVSFGQTRCDPVRPKCDGCPIARFCHSPKKRA